MKNLLHDIIYKINIGQGNGDLLLYSILIFLLTIIYYLIIQAYCIQTFSHKFLPQQCVNGVQIAPYIICVYYAQIYIAVVSIYTGCVILVFIIQILSDMFILLNQTLIGLFHLIKIVQVPGGGQLGSIEMLGGSGGVGIVTPFEFYTKGIRSLLNAYTTEHNQFIYDKLILHRLKQINSSYKNIELMALPNFDDYARIHYCIGNQHQNLNTQLDICQDVLYQNFPPGILKKYYQFFLNQDNLQSGDKWRGVPDAVFFNKDTKNMCTVQYKSTGGHNLEHFDDPEFPEKYNNNTHIMSILLKNPDKYSNLIEIINKRSYDFDILLRIGDNNISENLLLEMEIIDNVFMQEQGDYILRKFYRDFYNNNFSKLQVDEIFLQDFYECMKLHDGQQHVTTVIKGAKSDI